MGIKVTVVGGGSTYTPELVEGFVRRRDRLPIDELVLLDIDPERLEVVGGLAQRMLDRQDWTGRLTLHRATATPPSTAPTSCSSSCASAARRPGSSTRRCPCGSGSSARRRPAPAASPRRCGPSRSCSTSRSSSAGARRPGAWIVDFTNPVGIVTQALLDDGHRARRAVQRRDHPPAPAGRAVRRRTRSGSQLEHVGLNHLSWERAVRVDGVDRLPELLDDGRDELAGGAAPAGRPARLGRGDPVLLPALLLPDPDRPRRAAGRPHPGAGRHGHRGAAARDVPRPGPRREAGAPRPPRRGVLQRGRGPAHRLAPRRRGRRPGRRRPQRRRDARPAAPTPSSRSRPSSTATARIRSPRRRSRRSSAASSRRSRRTRS